MNEQIIQIDNATWCIHENMVRCFLFAGYKKALLVDTGMTIRGIREVCEKLTGLPVELLNTHGDPDHIGANNEFERMYMHPAEEENYRQFKGTGQIIPVWEGDEIDLGGRVLTVIELPGHTPGSIGLLDKETRVLVSGDMVQNGGIVMLGPGRNFEQYIASMIKLENKWMPKIDAVWGAHGEFPLPASIIPALRESAEHILAGEAEKTPCNFMNHQVMRYSWGNGCFIREN